MKISKRIITILLTLIFALSFAACNLVKTGEGVTKEETTTEAPKIINPLTGEDGLDPQYVGLRPIAVTIQNNIICRPQWGLGSADITIEAEVEGTETKQLWIYQDPTKLVKGGPFRSVRVDFVEMAMGFDAILVHCGWSSGVSYGAKELLVKTGYDHIDGGSTGYKVGSENGIWFRDSTAPDGKKRGVEYRSYTKGANIDKYLKSEKGQKIRRDVKAAYSAPLSFYEEKTDLPGGACNKITFKVGKHTYHWDYNTADGLYYGNYGDKALVANDGTKFSVENVVVLYLKSVKVMDKKERVDMDLSGGNGVIASNGTYQNITWTKGSTTDMFKFYDESGKEIKFNTGKTYIGLARAAYKDKTVIA